MMSLVRHAVRRKWPSGRKRRERTGVFLLKKSLAVSGGYTHGVGDQGSNNLGDRRHGEEAVVAKGEFEGTEPFDAHGENDHDRHDGNQAGAEGEHPTACVTSCATVTVDVTQRLWCDGEH